MNQERFDRIRLARSEGIGPVRYRKLMQRFGSAGEAIYALADRTQPGEDRPVALAPEGVIAREVERVAEIGAQWVILGDAAYPNLLAEAPDGPIILTVMGNMALTRQSCVAMVGARNASAAACRISGGLAHDLAAQGQVVVSGLARGIDTAAHVGALSAADGSTIAVIASGIDIAYPPQNRALQERIAAEGLLIAEQPPGAEPRARNFPHRNRIIAGLSVATVVVEAAPKSGSLITARLAGDYGREVLAVPGSPLDPRAHGCNELIRNGATLIQSAQDVIEAISAFTPPVADAQAVLPLAPAPDARAPRYRASAPLAGDSMTQDRATTLADLLGPVPVSVDELIRQSGLDPATVQTELLELELCGRLERHSGAKVALRPA